MAMQQSERSAPRAFSLDVIQIQSPCTEDWSAMADQGTKRFCNKCSMHVHDLSAMSSDEARALFESHNGRLCVRILRPAAPQAVPTIDHARESWWRRAAAALGLTMLGVWSGFLAGCGDDKGGGTRMMGSPAPIPTSQHAGIMGDVAVPAPTPGQRALVGEASCPPSMQPGTQPATQPARMLMGRPGPRLEK